MYCYSCGKENPDAASFCHACGKRLVASARPEEHRGKKINPHWFAFSLLAGILFLVVGTLSITAVGTLPAMVILGFGMAGVIFSFVYSLVSLYRCWGVLRGFSPRTTPSRAVGFSLIPFFNTYWVFVAIYGLAVDANAFTEQGGSKKKINETLSIATCFILILPIVNLIALILMTFLIYQWANFCNTAASPVNPSFVYPVSGKGKYLAGKFSINKVFACGLAGIVIILAGAEIIKSKRQENARAVAYAEAYYKSGHEYLKVGKSALAIEDLNKAIAANPDYAEAYSDRGEAYSYKGQYDKAIEDCSRAISINPNYAEAYLNRGRVYSFIANKGGKNDSAILEKAIGDYNKAIAINPNYSDAHISRGHAYLRKGKHDLAIEDYNKEIAINPNDADAYNYRGDAYAKKGQYDLAIEDFNRVIAMDPKDFLDYIGHYCSAYYYRGDAYAKKGQYDQAIRDYSKAITITPNALTHPMLYYRRGLAYSLKGQYDLAIEDYNKQIVIFPQHEAYYMRGVDYANKRNMGKAILDFQKACDMGNGSACERLAKIQKKK